MSYAELTDAGVLLVLLDTNSERPGGSVRSREMQANPLS